MSKNRKFLSQIKGQWRRECPPIVIKKTTISIDCEYTFSVPTDVPTTIIRIAAITRKRRRSEARVIYQQHQNAKFEDGTPWKSRLHLRRHSTLATKQMTIRPHFGVKADIGKNGPNFA
jgi:hypothetical protein